VLLGNAEANPRYRVEADSSGTSDPGIQAGGTVVADATPPRGGQPRDGDKAKGASPKPPRGLLSEADYQRWLKSHPKAAYRRVGPWLGEPIYKQYTEEYFTSRGFYLGGKMKMGSSGEHDEIWLHDGGNGIRIHVLRDPTKKQAPVQPRKPVPEEDDDEDVREAQKALKESADQMLRVQAKLKELLDQRGKPAFERLRKEYLELEAAWLERLRLSIEYVEQMWNPDSHNEQPSEDSKLELRDVLDKLIEYDHAHPFGDAWKGRSEIPARSGDPVRVKPPTTVKGDKPIEF